MGRLKCNPYFRAELVLPSTASKLPGLMQRRMGPIMQRFLLGTGRMPHPVGGAIGVALCTALKRGTHPL